ncbi:MAG: alpha/beta hydrolase, partial [Carbonactinosporaceae bacterium]
AEALGRLGGVVSFDFRGHGRSRGLSTLGALEVLDLDAAVRWARTLGYERVATVGWSLGGSTAVRHAALHSGVDAVVAVSSPSRWDNHDSVEMRRLQWMIQRRLGRVFARGVLRTRISPGGYDPMPAPPVELVGRLAPVPLLVVHGDRDSYLPLHHAEELHAAAGDPRALWIEQGFGHAEAGASDRLVARLGRWAIGALDTALSGTAQPARGGA